MMREEVPAKYEQFFPIVSPELTEPLQNIDFQTTILSRFDMIFIVKDEHNETRDKVRRNCLFVTQRRLR